MAFKKTITINPMRRNLLVGIFVAVMIYMTVTVTSLFQEKEKFDDGIKSINPIPQILILPPEPLEFHPLDRGNIAEPTFQIKIQNEIDDEVLEVVATLADAKEYIKEYGEYHDDLYVYDIRTNELVLKSIKND
tara:strand:- start:125 stop:523 length:399 start_codon:yes stop_codon:yes gene_type:complete